MIKKIFITPVLLLCLVICFSQRTITINKAGKPASVTINAIGKPSSVVIIGGQPYVPPSGPSRGIIIGNSTLAAYLANSVASYVFSPAEITAGYYINSIARAGDGIGEQKTRWDTVTNKTTYDWIWVQIGLNNVNPAQTVAAIMPFYQALIDDIRNDAPDIKIIIAKMSPGKGAWPTRYPGNEAAAEVKFLAMQDAMMGIGPNAITGADVLVSESYDLSVDGSGYLKTEYELAPPDGIHPNNTWRAILGELIHSTIEDLGFAKVINMPREIFVYREEYEYDYRNAAFF